MSKRNRQRHRYENEKREAEGEKRLAAMPAPLPVETVRALDAVAEIVERQKGDSMQPRFSGRTDGLLYSTFRWLRSCMTREPSDDSPVIDWDIWYREFAFDEPFLAGVLSSAVQIDTNRGWSITGGRNQVNKFSARVKSSAAFPGYLGWRAHVAFAAQSYYTTQMGFVTEVERESKNGPMLKLYSVDPCACILTADNDYPLHYHSQEWEPGDFIRGTSMIRTDESQLGYGYPAVARCYELGKVMLGLYSHYQQKLGSKTPDGILTGKFIDETQWKTALEARDEALRTDSDQYINSIATIMSAGDQMPEFMLTILSSIPDRFDVDVWTHILMRGYALAFGYQASEFYPESSGVMGRGNEETLQHRAATGKGGKDFALIHQERMQSILPQTIEFLYDERDVTGEIEDADLAIKRAQLVTELTKWKTGAEGMQNTVLNQSQILQLAADMDIIPPEWTPEEEDVTATDEDAANVQDESERIYRAMRAFPNEDIVRYNWPDGKVKVIKVPKRFYIRNSIKRQDETPDEIRDEYEKELGALVAAVIAGTMTARTMMREHRALLRKYSAMMYGAAGDSGDPDAAGTIDDWTAEQYKHVDDFANAAIEARDDKDKRDRLMERLATWAMALAALGAIAAMQKNRREEGVWRLGNTKEHCATCRSLDGQKHHVEWFLSRGFYPREPGSATLECGGYRCQCGIYSASDGRQLA